MSLPSYSEPALRLQNARLEALHEVAMGLTSTLELPEVLQRVVDMAQSLSNAAHAHIFLYDANQDEITHASGHWSAEERHVTLNPRRGGITYRVAHSGKAEFIEDTFNNPAYAEIQPDLRPGALACLPLAKGKHILGTLNLGFWQAHQFDDETLKFLELMAQHAAIAIETARLHASAIENAQLERELFVARELQASMIPRHTPRIPGWEFAALWQPAHIVSGDYYDFIPLDDSAALGLVIADVSDKGMPAALFMMHTRSTVRASITASCCPADFISRANRLISNDTTRGMFVTWFYAQIDPITNEVTYVNAGHNPPLYYQHERNNLCALTRTGIALGVDGSRSYEQRSIALKQGDLIIFYTDGVTDAQDSERKFFGAERLERLIMVNRNGSAKDFIGALKHELGEFVGATPQFDDITAVAAKREAPV